MIEWIRRGIDLGAGEILIASVDRDGTRKGYDLGLIKQITAISSIPVIVHGGAGNLESIEEVIKDGGADAISASSIFHYGDFNIRDVKDYLSKKGINVRI